MAGWRVLQDNPTTLNIRKDMLFDNIGIVLTNQCNAQCSMCCFECGPDKDFVLDEKLVFDIIEQASHITGIKRIGFTGGEAMLFPDLLMKAMEFAKRHSLDVTLTSNGFWAKDYNTALQKLEQLRKLGMVSLSISVDEYHLRYVGLECLTNLIRANRHIGIDFRIAVGDAYEGRSALDIIKKLDKDIYGQNLTIYPFMPVGKAAELAADKIFLRDYEASWRCCYNKNCAVLYDGSVYPCCSQAIYRNRICKGNIREKSLQDIISAYEDEGIFSTLVRQGFDFFVQIAREEKGWDIPRRYSSPCHLCHVLFSALEFVSFIQPHVQKEYLRHVKETLGLL
jgi:MoaA/NifB/PqqE/SkfB family radical SAM enzyme